MRSAPSDRSTGRRSLVPAACSMRAFGLDLTTTGAVIYGWAWLHYALASRTLKRDTES